MNSEVWKEKHRQFIGKPLSDLVHVGYMLTARERTLLTKYGAWMEALTKKDILPFTSEQEHFLKVDDGEVGAISEFEKTWVRLKAAREHLAKNPPKVQPTDWIFIAPYYRSPITDVNIRGSLVVFSSTDGQD